MSQWIKLCKLMSIHDIKNGHNKSQENVVNQPFTCCHEIKYPENIRRLHLSCRVNVPKVLIDQTSSIEECVVIEKKQLLIIGSRQVPPPPPPSLVPSLIPSFYRLQYEKRGSWERPGNVAAPPPPPPPPIL